MKTERQDFKSQERFVVAQELEFALDFALFGLFVKLWYQIFVGVFLCAT